MTRSSSPKAEPRDWPALLARAREADRQLSPEELDLWRRGILDGTANGWHVDLVHALQRATEGRDHAPLIAWLDAGMPIPGFCAPLIADALRMLANGTAHGRPRELSAADDSMIRWYFDKMTGGTLKRDAVRVRAELAERFEISEASIRRSLKRTG